MHSNNNDSNKNQNIAELKKEIVKEIVLLCQNDEKNDVTNLNIILAKAKGLGCLYEVANSESCYDSLKPVLEINLMNRNEDKYSILAHAARHGNFTVMKTLIEHGAEITHRSKGYLIGIFTPLYQLIFNDNYNCCKLVFESLVDINSSATKELLVEIIGHLFRTIEYNSNPGGALSFSDAEKYLRLLIVEYKIDASYFPKFHNPKNASKAAKFYKKLLNERSGATSQNRIISAPENKNDIVDDEKPDINLKVVFLIANFTNQNIFIYDHMMAMGQSVQLNNPRPFVLTSDIYFKDHHINIAGCIAFDTNKLEIDAEVIVLIPCKTGDIKKLLRKMNDITRENTEILTAIDKRIFNTSEKFETIIEESNSLGLQNFPAPYQNENFESVNVEQALTAIINHSKLTKDQIRQQRLQISQEYDQGPKRREILLSFFKESNSNIDDAIGIIHGYMGGKPNESINPELQNNKSSNLKKSKK